jgi:ABC-type antimicrobial peptide transport system ATPase subunit
VPPPTAWPTGCRFRPRCPIVHPRSAEMPPLLDAGPEHRMRCWLAVEPVVPATTAAGGAAGEDATA